MPAGLVLIGVSAIKIKIIILLLFIFNHFKITTSLKLESIRSQDQPNGLVVNLTIYRGLSICFFRKTMISN
jgi:hypothetical protein